MVMTSGVGKQINNNNKQPSSSSASSLSPPSSSSSAITRNNSGGIKSISPTTNHHHNNTNSLLLSSGGSGSSGHNDDNGNNGGSGHNDDNFYVKSHRSKKGIFGKRNSSVKYANSIVSMRTHDDDRRITIHNGGSVNQMLFNGHSLDLYSSSSNGGESGGGGNNLLIASDLPNEILIKIFTYLMNGISFYRVCLVCKSWYRAGEDEILWEQVCTLNYPNETQKMQKLNNRKNKITKFKNIYWEIVYNDFLLLKTGLFENRNVKFKKSPWSKDDYILYHSTTTTTSNNNHNHNNNNNTSGVGGGNGSASGGDENVLLTISPPTNGSSHHNHNNNNNNGTLVINQLMPVKIVVVGDGAVGKTSLLGRFANDEFLSDQYLPTIFDNFITYSTFDNKKWAVTIIDTAGSEDYDKIRPLSYTGCDLFICCFDLMNTSSFHNVSNIWIRELNSCAPNVPILLCGTKLDLRISNLNLSGSLKQYIDSKFSKYGLVTFDEGVALANKISNCVGYIETSAKSGQGVKKCIETAISYSCKYSLHQLVRYMPTKSPPTTTGSPNSDNVQQPTNNKRNSNCIIE